jgi:hypothetical protein
VEGSRHPVSYHAASGSSHKTPSASYLGTSPCSLKFVRNGRKLKSTTLQSRNAGRNSTSPACREAQRALKRKYRVAEEKILPLCRRPAHSAAERTRKPIYGPNEKLAVRDVSSRCLTPVVLDIIEQRCSLLRSLNSKFTNG